MTNSGNNIEAGVFETPEMMVEPNSGKYSELPDLKRQLPVKPPYSPQDEMPDFSKAVGGMVEGEETSPKLLTACPVVRVLFKDGCLAPVFLGNRESKVWIRISGSRKRPFDSKGIRYTHQLPATVVIIWCDPEGLECSQNVYVERADTGRLAEFELRNSFDDINELLSRLATGEIEIDEDEGDPTASGPGPVSADQSSAINIQDTQIRRMMRFVCQIGESQSRIPENRWGEFCNLLFAHLQDLGNQIKSGDTPSDAALCIQYFARVVRINPFNYLAELASYRPKWMKDKTASEQEKLWDAYKKELRRLSHICGLPTGDKS